MNTASTDFSRYLQHTLQCSRYAKRTLEADPTLLEWLQQNYVSRCERAEIEALLLHSGADLHDELVLARAVRYLRKQVMLKLILRDLNGLADLREVMQAMTALAEICVQQAHKCLMQSLTSQFGSPIGDTSQQPQEMLIIGMGKLGGGELNVSSDIDLIFIYPEDGETNGARTLSNHEFFTRLGRKLINIINELTADGYVFRVDMRLRPYGDSGPLVMSFAALEEYLVSQGREWERYAWIKARVIAPANDSHITELSALTRPFVFRKYLDFSAIDSMRKLHAQIRQEVQRRDRLNNIKLGPGGIREIEFTAQVFQLIRAGREAKLRVLPTQQVLQTLAHLQLLDAEIVTRLDNAYVFLRNLEHRLQYLDDQQTQELPQQTDAQHSIALAMGYTDFAELLILLNQHREFVSQQFEAIFSRREETDELQLWREGISDEALQIGLATLGYRAAIDTAQRLLQLRAGSRYRQLPDSSRQLVDKLVPRFISLSACQADPDSTLSRLLNLLEAISRRASYLAFLAEYPEALMRLVKLISASRWASDYLTQHPALFDELLDARELYQPPAWATIEADLSARIAEHHEDAEGQIEVLHQVQQEQIFHLLAMDLQDLLPLEKLSDHLSDLADLILKYILQICWASARKRHRSDAPRFAIIAYGKLGGKELGYASDLDLIFLYQDEHPDAQEVYARLAQRINTLLGSHTASGRLYETDLRLRPNGASGLLVSSVEAFSDYQQHHAWVWEHQALTRARFSAGDAVIGVAFEKIRQQILCQPRNLAKLKEEIVAMRQKMHEGHPNHSGLFDIKHDSGGMVDIEFIVQFMVLAHAHAHPELCTNAGNIALLNQAATLHLITSDLAEKNADLYRQLRRIQHRMRLNNEGACRIAASEIDTHACLQLWHELLGDSCANQKN